MNWWIKYIVILSNVKPPYNIHIHNNVEDYERDMNFWTNWSANYRPSGKKYIMFGNKVYKEIA